MQELSSESQLQWHYIISTMHSVSKQLKISIRLPLIPTQTCINLSSLTMVPKTTKSFVVECVKRTATYDRAGTRRGEIVKSISTLYFTPFHQARFCCLESSPFQKHLTYPSPFVRAARYFCRDISANKTKYQAVTQTEEQPNQSYSTYLHYRSPSPAHPNDSAVLKRQILLSL